MLIEENRGADGFTVTAYGGGTLEIGGKIYREPVVLKDGIVGPIDGRKPSDLSAADFFQTASSDLGLLSLRRCSFKRSNSFLSNHLLRERCNRITNAAISLRILVLSQRKPCQS